MRLYSILFLLFFVNILQAQSRNQTEKWLGVHNVFFKHQEEAAQRFTTADSTNWIVDDMADKQFSFGLSFRKVDRKGGYQQFDLIEMNWTTARHVTEFHSNNGNFVEHSGNEVKTFRTGTGYQRGRLLPIIKNLQGDVGLRGFLWYERTNDTPFRATGFPFRHTSTGLSLNIELGLVYQLHERIKIGYHFIPAEVRGYWNEIYLDNPVLTESQKRERSIEVDTNFFESILDFRNIQLNYVF